MHGVVHKPTASTPSSAGAKPTIPLMTLKSSAAAGAKPKGSTPSSATAVDAAGPNVKVCCVSMLYYFSDILSDINM